MAYRNPKIDGAQTSVQTLITALRKSPRARFTAFGSKAIPTFTGAQYHYQGIAPFNIDLQSPGNGIISASSTEAYFSLLAEVNTVGTLDVQVRSVVKPNTAYFHAGGMQMVGTLLPVPLESNDSTKKGIVSFYDAGRHTAAFKYELETPSRKASATAITTYTQNNQEYALLFVYQYDDFQMYIYRAGADAIGGTSPSVWTLMRTYSGSAFNARGISNSKQYQSFALVTQTAAGVDTVFLLGFRGDETLVLWSINLTSTPTMQNGMTVETTFGEPTLVTEISGFQGANWENAVGLQIRNSNTLRIYATDADPTGSQSNYQFDFFVYA